MNVVINGTALQVDEGATVHDAIARVTTATDGVAVAVNDEVVSRSAWSTAVLADGDRVEVLTAVQGG
ncbi:MAG TPA: sulfur carrier protein ThiS [Streptosporangiaceae bacterium]|jgi:sulfur carrier protein|nr:sulfur carrier protein ThiS [Streptosporangiaceae bacterium]